MSDYTPTAQELIAAWVEAHQVPAAGGKIDAEARPKERIAEAKRGIAAIEREAAARALLDAVIDFESGEVTDQDIKFSTVEPKGWADVCVHDAIINSGPIMDWLRARAAEIREKGQGE